MVVKLCELGAEADRVGLVNDHVAQANVSPACAALQAARIRKERVIDARATVAAVRWQASAREEKLLVNSWPRWCAAAPRHLFCQLPVLSVEMHAFRFAGQG